MGLFDADNREIIAGSRLKAAWPLVMIVPPLLIGGGDEVAIARDWILAILCGGAAALRTLTPGRFTLDDRGLEWRTMFSGRRMDWSEVAYAAIGSTYRRWSRAYIELADLDGAPAMARVWIPGSWTISQAQLVERINAAREKAKRSPHDPYAAFRVEAVVGPSSPAQTRQALSARPDPEPPPAAAPSPSPSFGRPNPASPSAPVFGRRRSL